MNNEEKNVMTILTIARVVESSLWYLLPPRTGSFDANEREARCKALTALTAEGSPFAVNCDNNGEVGAKLKEDVQYFIEDVYANPGRIVTVDINGKVAVEESLRNELFTNIVTIRQVLDGFLVSALKALEAGGKLTPDFDEIVKADIKYYHCFAGKISCMLARDKFLEINKSAQQTVQAYMKSHGGQDPRNDKSFNFDSDPSFRMMKGEFQQINQDMLIVLNGYPFADTDEEFKNIRDSVYDDCGIFQGTKKPTDAKAFFNNFVTYFDRTLDVNQPRLNRLFEEMGKKIRDEAAEETPAAETPTPEAPAPETSAEEVPATEPEAEPATEPEAEPEAPKAEEQPAEEPKAE